MISSITNIQTFVIGYTSQQVELEMDLTNNRIGRELGELYQDNDMFSLADKIIENIKNGNLYVKTYEWNYK